MSDQSAGDKSDQLQKALSTLSPGDIRLDPEGRVVITNPTIAEQLKAAGATAPLDALARNDTNIICCGNTKCASRATDLGSMVERFAGGTQPR